MSPTPPLVPRQTPPATPVRPVIGRNTLSVFATVVGIALAVCVVCMIVVLEFGILQVSWFPYHGNVPRRSVAATPIDQVGLIDSLTVQLQQQMIERVVPPYRLVITEGELTGIVSTALPNALRGTWSVRSTSVAIDPQDVQFDASLVRGMLHADIHLRFVPSVRDNGITLDLVGCRIGSVPIAPSLATRILTWVFARDMGQFQLQAGDLHVQQIELRSGEVLLLIQPIRP